VEQIMPKEFWINLPVRDVARSRKFFTDIGFAFDAARSNESMACMLMGDKGTVVMLFPDSAFQQFAGTKVTDTAQASEVLLSIDAASPGEVDDTVRRAEQAGATVFARPAEAGGWMYGGGFADPDGHRWNVLYMDTARMPAGAAG
jgi:uncharacterized protein